VANDQRGVISPCGRCRQQMFDWYPHIKVIIKDGNELRTATVDELLPFAYVSGFKTKLPENEEK
jgi:cytidine deaminase